MVVEVAHGAIAVAHHEAQPLPHAHSLPDGHRPRGLIEAYQTPHQEVLHSKRGRPQHAPGYELTCIRINFMRGFPQPQITKSGSLSQCGTSCACASSVSMDVM